MRLRVRSLKWAARLGLTTILTGMLAGGVVACAGGSDGGSSGGGGAGTGAAQPATPPAGQAASPAAPATSPASGAAPATGGGGATSPAAATPPAPAATQPPPVAMPADEPFRIGAMHALTGVAESYGNPILQAMTLAVEEINDGGGVNGRMLALIPEDSKCAAQDAITAYNKLTDVDGVKIILGTTCSGAMLGAAPWRKPRAW